MISGLQSSTTAYNGFTPKAPSALGESTTPSALSKEKEPNTQESSDPYELTDAEKEQVRKLELRDVEVRNHERAHIASAGSLARGEPTYEYQLGPDGKNYAIGGHVDIETSPGKTPEETKQKAAQIQASALAAKDPSAQDLKVAAEASSMAVEAERKEDSNEENDEVGQAKDANPKSANNLAFEQVEEETINTSDPEDPLAPQPKFQNMISVYEQAGNEPREAIYHFEA